MADEMTSGEPEADMGLANFISRSLENPEARERPVPSEGCRYCDTPHPSVPCGCGHEYHGHGHGLEPGLGSRCLNCMCDKYVPQPEGANPVEPDDPAALALARHISDHPTGTVQAAFRLLGFSLNFNMVEDEGAGPEGPCSVPVLAKGYLGTAAMLDEMLRRAALKGPTERSA